MDQEDDEKLNGSLTGQASALVGERLPAVCSLPTIRDPDASRLPSLIIRAGTAAQFAYEEFFHGRLRNPATRKAYGHAVSKFLSWCEERGTTIERIAPAHIGRYLDALPHALTTKKLRLAALRCFFDALVTRHVVILNPAASVRAERYQVVEGKTPEIGVEQARGLLQSVDVSHVVGLRDRAIIAVMIYTTARVGAVAKLRRQDIYENAGQSCLRFTEKGGKSREIPCRHDLQDYLAQYMATAGLADADRSSHLFRSTIRRTRLITTNGMTAGDIGRMVKRRLRDAGLSDRLSPHSFRVTTITDLLAQGVPLEDVQYLAGHSDPRTTRLYDRRQRRVTRNIVERISV